MPKPKYSKPIDSSNELHLHKKRERKNRKKGASNQLQFITSRLREEFEIETAKPVKLL